jgi:small conductance mechanosensitive channel
MPIDFSNAWNTGVRLISVTAIEGTVYDIQSRATVITTKEGRQVIIPNAIIFTDPVAVDHPAGQAAPERARSSPGGNWQDLFRATFRRPSSPGAK